MSTLDLGIHIKREYSEHFVRPFPLDDLKKLRKVDSSNIDLFHGQLELYLSDIAGYAEGADRLFRRPAHELAKARRRLSKSFFEKHPALRVYEGHITKKWTPALYGELLTADRLRKDLLVLLDHITESSR
jgi:hypothetical protein